MSTASPLPLQPLPPTTVSEQEQDQLRLQVTERLAEHRKRRSPLRAATAQPALPGMEEVAPRRQRGKGIADSVAARFAKSVSYRDFLQQEAEVAMRQAEAAAEIARRNANAIAVAQQQLLDEIDQWNKTAEDHMPLAATLFEMAAAPEPGAATVATPVMPEAHIAAAPSQPQSFADMLAAEMAKPEEVVPYRFVPDGPLETPTALPTNLIEFPRQLVAARKARPRLAEGPLRDEADASPDRAQLRIFEVEASAFSTVPSLESASALPEWSSIRLDSWQAPHDATHPDAQTSTALPIYTAPVSRRCMAAAVDACCIGAAFLLAVAAAAYASPVLPQGGFATLSAIGTLVAFGIMYLLLFSTLADATPGMRYARIAFCTFSDDNPTRKAIRKRLFAMALAAVPLGLGFAWALLDEDRLGWHDRISRMYQRAY